MKRKTTLNVSDRLNERRIVSGKTQGEAATHLGTSQVYISNLESGKNTPATWDVLVGLAECYQTSTDYILGLTDNPLPLSGERTFSERAERVARLIDRQQHEDLKRLCEEAVVKAVEEYERANKEKLSRLFALYNLIERFGGQELRSRFERELGADSLALLS